MCGDIVPRYTPPVCVHEPEIALSCRLALIGCLLKPARRSRIILGSALAVDIHEPEIDLSRGVALIGRPSIPTHRSRIVLRHTTAILVNEPEIVLSICVSLVCGEPEEASGLAVVLR